jgi:hypothetical protein
MPTYLVSESDQKYLDQAFTYHPPHDDQAERYGLLRGHGRLMAEQILSQCPPSRERSLALTKLQECVMWANAAIACSE